MPTGSADQPAPAKPAAPAAEALPDAPDPRDLPQPLTFFVSGRERAQILRALRRIDGNRAFALKRALRLA